MSLTKLLSYKNRHLNEDALIVACGPSSVHWKKIYAEYPNSKIISIKQAINMTKDLTSYHFFNPYNCSNYSSFKELYSYETIFQDDIRSPRQFNEYDLRLVIRKDERKPYDTCIALTHAFSEFDIENSMLIRPWGPGILFDSVLYFLKYCGFSQINIVGFDMKNNGKYNQHFYDNQVKMNSTKNKASHIADKETINYFKHLANIQYNVMEPYVVQGFDEPELAKAMYPKFADYLLSKGCKVHAFTTSKWLAEVDYTTLMSS